MLSYIYLLLMDAGVSANQIILADNCQRLMNACCWGRGGRGRSCRQDGVLIKKNEFGAFKSDRHLFIISTQNSIVGDNPMLQESCVPTAYLKFCFVHKVSMPKTGRKIISNCLERNNRKYFKQEATKQTKLIFLAPTACQVSAFKIFSLYRGIGILLSNYYISC